MFAKILHLIRISVLIGMLVSMVGVTPALAAGSVGSPHEAVSAPTLVSPANGSVTTTLQPVMKWNSSADHFEIQVSRNSTFTDLVVNELNFTTLQYSTGTLDQTTVFYWRVKAYNVDNVASNWSAVWKFKTPLAPPLLVAPTPGESLLTDRTTFDWDPVPTAAQYIFQISLYNNFSSLILNTTISATEYPMTKDLPQNKTVYWRVQAKNAISKGAWSAGSFHTGNPPSVPVLAAPANGSLVKDYTPLLNWSNATAPGGTDFKEYQVQADDNSDFSSPEVDATTTLNTVANSDFTPLSDLTSNTKFFWRVRSRNIVNGAEEHFSAWSTVWTFRTVIQQPQNLTMVDNAANHLRPTFDWDDATGTITNYTIQISTVANFSSFFVNSTTASSGYTLLKNLPANKTIYVRVKVNGANGPSAWTTIQFTSAAAP